jgi:hypothetical protein
MRKQGTITVIIALGMFASAAWAGSWGDYSASFPLHPCQDGWLGCIVDGKSYSSDLAKDSKGYPTPANARVSWHDLRPTGYFSPFVKLSEYTGELAIADGGDDEGSADGDFVDEVPEDDGPSDDGPSDDGPSDDGPSDDGPADDGPSDDGSADDGPADDGPPDNGRAETTPETSSNNSSSEDGSMVRPKNDEPKEETKAPSNDGSVSRPSNDGATNNNSVQPVSKTPSNDGSVNRTPKNDGVASLPPVKKPPENAIISKAVKPMVATDNSCDDLKKIEPMAIMGKLGKGQVNCLEGRLDTEAKQTSKDKISRVLMANAYASGDKRTWEKLVKRHLTEIDQSDPDLCYKYARHLNGKGPGRAKGVIKWADIALENRFNWTGSTYKARVYNLYKLKAQGAQTLWQSAEKAYSANPSPDAKNKKEKARNQTKVFAREWLEYATEAGRDKTKALQLCMSAAGTEDYCEGG